MLAEPVAANLFEGFFSRGQARATVRHAVRADLLAESSFFAVRINEDITAVAGHEESERLAEFRRFNLEFHADLLWLSPSLFC